MAKVLVSIYETELESDAGFPVTGVRAQCEKCGHETESYGNGEGSRLRCLALMREECPEGEANYYSEE